MEKVQLLMIKDVFNQECYWNDYSVKERRDFRRNDNNTIVPTKTTTIEPK